MSPWSHFSPLPGQGVDFATCEGIRCGKHRVFHVLSVRSASFPPGRRRITGPIQGGAVDRNRLL